MRSIGWKIAAFALLLYAAVRSLLTPLNPCVIDVNRGVLSPGEQLVEVIGYRTDFTTEDQQAMLRSRGVLGADTVEHWICGETLPGATATHAQVRFQIPANLPDTVLDLYVNNRTDGTTYLPNAFRLEGFVAGRPTAASCDIEVARNNPETLGFPFQTILYESIRNLCWHVPMWFTMFLLMLISAVNALGYLMRGEQRFDDRSAEGVNVGLLFCLLGLITGSFWARFTWGDWWVDDPQLNGAMVTFMIYVAYVILRNSIDDDQKRARIAAVYNLFAVVMLVVLLMILPRFTESLHPGKSGNPAFSQYDLDDTLRWVFYPAVLGWMLLSLWMFNLRVRMVRVARQLENRDMMS